MQAKELSIYSCGGIWQLMLTVINSVGFCCVIGDFCEWFHYPRCKQVPLRWGFLCQCFVCERAKIA